MCRVSRCSNEGTKEINKTGDREVEIEGSNKLKQIAEDEEGENGGRRQTKVAAQNRANLESKKQTNQKEQLLATLLSWYSHYLGGKQGPSGKVVGNARTAPTRRRDNNNNNINLFMYRLLYTLTGINENEFYKISKIFI